MTSVPEKPTANGKIFPTAQAALEGVFDGASVLVAGWSGSDEPEKLLRGLGEIGVGNLTLVCQGAWAQKSGQFGIADLVATGQVKKMVCTSST